MSASPSIRSELMVGSELPTPETTESTVTDIVLLQIENLVVNEGDRAVVSDVSLTVHPIGADGRVRAANARDDRVNRHRHRAVADREPRRQRRRPRGGQ